MATTMKELQRRWDPTFSAAARERGMRTVGGYAYVDDGAMVTTAAILLGARTDPLRVKWWVEIKPLALDDILWAAFLPDMQLGPVKRRNLRVSGAFVTPALQLGSGEHLVGITADPAPTIAGVLNAFESLRSEYLRVAPRAEDFLDQLHARPEGALPKPSYSVLREALTLMSLERYPEASALLNSAIDRGERGHMWNSEGPVFEVLIKYIAAIERRAV